MLADRLNMTVGQLEEEMTYEEFIEWTVYLTIQREEAEKARRAAKNGTKHPIRHQR